MPIEQLAPGCTRITLTSMAVNSLNAPRVISTTSSRLTTNYSIEHCCKQLEMLYESCSTSQLLEAGGKPSTWLPPGRLVEHL